MSALQIRLIGVPCAHRAGQAVPLASRNGWLILATLACEKQIARTRLAARLWPDHREADARGRLRRVLSELQKQLGETVVESCGELLRLVPAMHACIDLCRLGSWLQSPDAAPQLPLLQEFAALPRAELLADIEPLGTQEELAEWLQIQREQLRQCLLRALRRAWVEAGAAGEGDAAARFAAARMRLDPLDEEAVCDAMQSLAATAERSTALRAFEAYERWLDAELGIRPSARALACYADLRRAAEPALPCIGEVGYARSRDGVHIAWRVLGRATTRLPVLVVPGFVSHLEVGLEAPGPREFFLALAAQRQVVLFDRRGVGLSERLGCWPSVEATVEDMLAVLDGCGLARAVLAGFSEGGPACIAFAARYPGRVGGLCLYASMARGTRAPGHPHALSAAQHRKWLAAMTARWGQPAGLAAFAPSRCDDPDLRAWWSRLLRAAATPSSLQYVLREFSRVDVSALLPQLRCPCVVLHRDGDRAVPLGAGRSLAAAIPGARLQVQAGDDHWWWIGEQAPLLAAFGELG